MIPVREALDIVLGAVAPLPPEKVSLLEARGRVLAEDVRAPRDLPPRDNSAMDGYAFRRAALGPGPARLRIVGAVMAGGVPPAALAAGEAVRIMTGAPIPEGADAVVPLEEVAVEGEWVRVAAPPEVGDNVRPAGEDVRGGALVLPRGTAVRAPEVGMLASLGRSFVLVCQRPRVAILATGDEIADLDAPTEGGRIYNSNSYGLAAQVWEAGGVPLVLGIGRDDPEGLAEMLERAATADAVLTTGGVSVGDHDYVRPALAAAGVAVRFWKVAMKPGKPLVFGMRGRVPFFGLPGNPVSALVGFEQFVRPALRRLQGHRLLFRPVLTARLASGAGPVRGRSGRTDFIRCRLERQGSEFRVVSVKEQGSGILRTLVESNALLLLPPGVGHVDPGEEVLVQVYDPGFLDGDAPGFPGA